MSVVNFKEDISPLEQKIKEALTSLTKVQNNIAFKIENAIGLFLIDDMLRGLELDAIDISELTEVFGISPKKNPSKLHVLSEVGPLLVEYIVTRSNGEPLERKVRKLRSLKTLEVLEEISERESGLVLGKILEWDREDYLAISHRFEFFTEVIQHKITKLVADEDA